MNHLHQIPKIDRSNINGIIFEYLINSNSLKAVILIDGLPRVPCRKESIERLYLSGFSVFYPRLRGTWESDGNFLNHNPTEDIKELALSLNQGLQLGNESYRSKEIFVLASSFGGAVAWSLADLKEIAKVVFLSPVYDFKAVTGITTLRDYLKSFYTNGYRFDDRDWDRLLSNNLIALPGDLSAEGRKKCHVIGGETDIQVTSSGLQDICNRQGIECTIVEDAGHISLQPKMESIWLEIMSNLR